MSFHGMDGKSDSENIKKALLKESENIIDEVYQQCLKEKFTGVNIGPETFKLFLINCLRAGVVLRLDLSKQYSEKLNSNNIPIFKTYVWIVVIENNVRFLVYDSKEYIKKGLHHNTIITKSKNKEIIMQELKDFISELKITTELSININLSKMVRI